MLILSHIFSALFALIISVSIIFIKFLKDKRTIFVFSLKHYLLTFGLTAFWTLPFLFKINNSITSKAQLNSFIFYTILFFATIILLKSLIKKQIQEPIFYITFASAILCIFIISTYYLTELPLHHYRFIFMIFVLFIIMIFHFINDKIIILQGSLCLVLLFLLFTHPNLPLEEPTAPQIDLQLNSTPYERTYIIASPEEQTSHHQLQHQITMQYRLNSLKGIYVESTPTSIFVMHLEKQIDSDAMHWGVYLYPALWNTSISEDILKAQLNYLNVNQIISTKNKTKIGLLNQTIKTTFHKDNFNRTYTDFYLYDLENTALIEVLNKNPKYVKTKDWINESIHWFMSENVTKHILVFEETPPYAGTGNEQIIIKNITTLNDKIDFFVDSETDVPILIKISYFPNWKAYSENESLKIYKTSINSMLIYGKGELKLRYESVLIDKVSAIISILTLILMIYLIFNNYKERI